jgi:hypothetical protein
MHKCDYATTAELFDYSTEAELFSTRVSDVHLSDTSGLRVLPDGRTGTGWPARIGWTARRSRRTRAVRTSRGQR